MSTLSYTQSYIRSLKKLTVQEKGLVQEFIVEFMEDKTGSGISLEPIQRTKNKNLWSGRVNDDLRMILLKNKSEWKMVYVDHHDKAYKWAARKRIHVDSNNTFVIEQVEWKVVEKIEEKVKVKYAPIFKGFSEEYLTQLLFPPEALPSIYELRTEEQVLNFVEEIGSPLGDTLLDLFDGKVVTPETVKEHIFNANQAQGTIDEEVLERYITEGQLPDWLTYLTEEQKELVIADFEQIAWLTGAAGTGKSIVALHRAQRLAKEGCQVTLLTHSETLSVDQQNSIAILCQDEPELLANIQCMTTDQFIFELAKAHRPSLEKVYNHMQIQKPLKSFCQKYTPPTSQTPDEFVQEWLFVVGRWGCIDWSDFKILPRTGRLAAYTLEDRYAVWKFIRKFKLSLWEKHIVDVPTASHFALQYVLKHKNSLEHDCIIVDEAQDLDRSQLRVLKHIAEQSSHPLFLVGDENQRILPHQIAPHAIDPELKLINLTTCHRTTESIKRYAERVIPNEHIHTNQTLEAGHPVQEIAASNSEEEFRAVEALLDEWTQNGLSYGDIAIVHRLKRRSDPLRGYLEAHLPEAFTEHNTLNFLSSFNCKGIEFDGVIFVGAEKEMLPYPKKHLKGVDLVDHVERDKQFLYVALTRARKRLAVTWIGTRTAFLDRS